MNKIRYTNVHFEFPALLCFVMKSLERIKVRPLDLSEIYHVEFNQIETMERTENNLKVLLHWL